MSPKTADSTSATPALEEPAGRPFESLEDEKDAIVLDPKDSERQYWRDPMTGVIREIWRPGDGPGVQSAEGWELKKVPADIKQRWRFYQSSNGPIKRFENEPPRFVILDDKAAYEVLQSDIPRTHLPIAWNLDFGGGGTIRQKRVHRGRGAIGDPDAEGNDKYHFGYHGNKKDQYYFTGESKDSEYRPVIYREATGEEPHKRKAGVDDIRTATAEKKAKTNDAVLSKLTTDAIDRPDENVEEATSEQEILAGNESPGQSDEGMWVEQDDHDIEPANAESGIAGTLEQQSARKEIHPDDGSDTSDDEFPFRRQAATWSQLRDHIGALPAHGRAGNEYNAFAAVAHHAETASIKVEDSNANEADPGLSVLAVKVEDNEDIEDEANLIDTPHTKDEDSDNDSTTQVDADAPQLDEAHRDISDLLAELEQAQLTIQAQAMQLRSKEDQLAIALQSIRQLSHQLDLVQAAVMSPVDDVDEEDSENLGSAHEGGDEDEAGVEEGG